MESLSLRELHKLGARATVRFANGIVPLGEIDADGSPVEGWRPMYPFTSDTPLGTIGWVIEGEIVRYTKNGAIIRVTRVLAQGKYAKPPKIGSETYGGRYGFFLPPK